MSQPKEFTHCIQGATLEQCVVALDNSSYANCTFKGCTVTYAGANLSNMTGCSFDLTQFLFIGPAGNAIRLLALFYANPGMRSLIEDVFAAIRGERPLDTVAAAKDLN